MLFSHYYNVLQKEYHRMIILTVLFSIPVIFGTVVTEWIFYRCVL